MAPVTVILDCPNCAGKRADNFTVLWPHELSDYKVHLNWRLCKWFGCSNAGHREGPCITELPRGSFHLKAGYICTSAGRRHVHRWPGPNERQSAAIRKAFTRWRNGQLRAYRVVRKSHSAGHSGRSRRSQIAWAIAVDSYMPSDALTPETLKTCKIQGCILPLAPSPTDRDGLN
jgi:hypothetical protein